MDLSEELVERIISSLNGGLPEGVTVVRLKQRLLALEVSDGFLLRTGARRPGWNFLCRIGVRNRDGISPYSIAWAVWFALNAAVDRSRRTGTPWPKEIAADMQAFTQPRGGMVHGWITAPGHGPVVFPPIDISDVPLVRRSWKRLPFPLPRRFRLPRTGPVNVFPATAGDTVTAGAADSIPPFVGVWQDPRPDLRTTDNPDSPGASDTVQEVSGNHTRRGRIDIGRQVKLDPVLCERILDSIKPLLPDGVYVKRRRGHVLVVMTRRKGVERSTTTAGAFGHLPRRVSRQRSVELIYREVLNILSDHLTRGQIAWPGLTPTMTTTTIQAGEQNVEARIADADGNSITFPAVSTT